MRKGCARTREIAILLHIFGDRTSFRAKGLPDLLQIAILLQFLVIEPFRAKGFAGPFANRNFTSVFGDRTLFVRKGSPDLLQIAILLQFLAIEPRFVRKGCVLCRLVGTAPRLQERNRKEGENKRAREQEGKRKCEDEKM